MSFIFRILSVPAVIVWRHSNYRDRINADVKRFYSVHCPSGKDNMLGQFLYELRHVAEFRSLFYYRTGPVWGRVARLPLFYLRIATQLAFGCPRDKLGGGIFIQHGYCCDVEAESIGEGLWLNQKVTIGWERDGRPTIGRNVRIGTGANVIGKIRIGDNVTIGAGTTVVKDVPDNTTVVSQPARYITKIHN